MAIDDMGPPPSPQAPGSVHDLFDERRSPNVWDFLDDMTSETQLRAHLKTSTPPPPAALLVMTWRTRQELKTVRQTSADVLSELSEVRGEVSGVQTTLQTLVDIIGARGKWAEHVARVCSVTSSGIGAVVKSIVDDVWVKRMLAFALIVFALGYSGYGYFNASKGDASINFGESEPHDPIPPHPHEIGVVPVREQDL